MIERHIGKIIIIILSFIAVLIVINSKFLKKGRYFNKTSRVRK